MPDFQLERSGSERPLLKLPPSGLMAGGGPPVGVYVELGKAEAGCYICRRPIPANTSRVTFKVTVEVIEDPQQFQPPAPIYALGQANPVAWLGPDPLTSKTRTQSYHVHPGCITKPMGSEAIRQGVDCWDCGALGMDSDRREEMRAGWGFCFTTHKFAWGVLCKKCQTKPKWLRCGHCEVFYPRHMISSGQPDESRKFGLDEEHPRQDRGDWCTHCAARFGVMTSEQVQEARDEFEETRKRIMKGGVF